MLTLSKNMLLLLVFFLTLPTSLALADQDNSLLLQQATTFFHQANENQNAEEKRKIYKKALLRYETISKAVSNGKLYYNIGNTYFMLDNIGQAIANYRRAEQFIPNDKQLQQNLGLALKKRQDIIPVKQEEKLLHTLFFWHYDLSPNMRFILFSSVYVAFWLSTGLMLLIPLPIPRSLPVSLLTLTMLLSSSLLIERFGEKTINGVIIAPQIKARQGDGANYQPSFTTPLHAGTEFSVLEHRDKWLHVELYDGRQCWLPTMSSELI